MIYFGNLGGVIKSIILDKYIYLGFTLSKIARKKGSNLTYELVFRYYFNLKILNAAKNDVFIGEGQGGGGNRVFRKIYHSETWLFEKILKVKSDEFNNCEYFYLNVYKYFVKQNVLSTPRLVKQLKNNNLCAFYFEFVKFVPCRSVDEHLTFGIAAVTGLLTINPGNLDLLKTIKLTEFFNRFVSNAYESFDIVNLTGLNLNEFCETAFDLQIVFSHGDLWSNVSDNLIIDWDSSGFLPLGCELGLLLAKYSRHDFIHAHERITGSDVSTFIETTIKRFKLPQKIKSWNVLFFTFISMMRYHKEKEFDIIEVLKLNHKLNINFKSNIIKT